MPYWLPHHAVLSPYLQPLLSTVIIPTTESTKFQNMWLNFNRFTQTWIWQCSGPVCIEENSLFRNFTKADPAKSPTINVKWLSWMIYYRKCERVRNDTKWPPTLFILLKKITLEAIEDSLTFERLLKGESSLIDLKFIWKSFSNNLCKNWNSWSSTQFLNICN